MTAQGEYLPFPALTAIHWVHRVFAVAVILLISSMAIAALKIDGLRNIGRWLLIVVAMQFTTGALTVFLQYPLALAVLHNGGAALLVLLLVSLNYKVRFLPVSD